MLSSCRRRGREDTSSLVDKFFRSAVEPHLVHVSPSDDGGRCLIATPMVHRNPPIERRTDYRLRRAYASISTVQHCRFQALRLIGWAPRRMRGVEAEKISRCSRGPTTALSTTTIRCDDEMVAPRASKAAQKSRSSAMSDSGKEAESARRLQAAAYRYNCQPCKQRKTKCDRVRPCASCQLRGTQSACYADDVHPASNTFAAPDEAEERPHKRTRIHTPPTHHSASAIRQHIAMLRSTIDSLEAELGGTSEQSSPQGPIEPSGGQELMLTSSLRLVWEDVKHLFPPQRDVDRILTYFLAEMTYIMIPVQEKQLWAAWQQLLSSKRAGSTLGGRVAVHGGESARVSGLDVLPDSQREGDAAGALHPHGPTGAMCGSPRRWPSRGRATSSPHSTERLRSRGSTKSTPSWTLRWTGLDSKAGAAYL
ncbi:hypothetical protein L1887_60491 [Cichorium endivia]|nr:hypothetical protein L1887_60491 [Cichorium endivia]